MADIYTDTAIHYDLAPIYQKRGDKDFYLARALEAKGPVLELGCGTGRILAPIAKAGVDITGLDSSEAMLDYCRRATSARLIHGDMTNFDLGRKFALITIPFRPFQHLLDVPEQLACLECVRRHLAPGGRFIFDVYNPRMDLIIKEDSGEFLDFKFTNREGQPMERRIRRIHHDAPRQVIEMEMIFVNMQTGERSTAPLVMRYFFRYELEHLLARCGFKIASIFGDFDGSPFGDGAKELIFTATC